MRNSSILVGVSFLVLASAFVCECRGRTNLLNNGGFETAGSGDGTAAWWEWGNPDQHGGVWGSAVRTSWRNNPATPGSYEATIQGQWAALGTEGGWWQEAAGLPDTEYRLGGWFYSDLATAETMGVTFEFWQGASGPSTLLGAATNILTNEKYAWHYESFEAVAPASCDWVRVIVFAKNVGTSGSLQFDDLYLEVVESNSLTRYVSQDGSHTWPFTNWATAANDIQSAVDAADGGDTVLVTNGTYVLSREVFIYASGIDLRSVNGAGSTVIDGYATTRCVHVTHPDAALDGFTLTHGWVRDANGGAGVFCEGAAVRSCIVISNNAPESGGVFPYGGGILCTDAGRVESCFIGYNTAAVGGGVSLSAEGTMENCTVVHNVVTRDGGGIHCRASTRVRNSIIVSNTIANVYCVNGPTTNLFYTCTTPSISGTGNTSADPQFEAPGAGSFRLAAGSPCIDAGTADVEVPVYDLDGSFRPLDGDGDSAAVLDIGAYEFRLAVADVDEDDMADAWEVEHFGNIVNCTASADSDGDGISNYREYVADTAPTNLNSRFEIQADPAGLSWSVAFSSSDQRIYRLERCDELKGDPVWIPVTADVLGTGGTLELSDPSGSGCRFYRIRVSVP